MHCGSIPHSTQRERLSYSAAAACELSDGCKLLLYVQLTAAKQ